MIIDSRVIRTSIGDDLEAIREASSDFLPAARTDIARIAQAVSQHDVEGVRAASHRLKGSAAIFGANDLKFVCAALESASSDIDWDSIQPLVPELAARLTEVEVALEGFLERISSGYR